MTDAAALVTDSTADLPADLAAEIGVAVVPALIMLEGESYEDGGDLSRPEFYRRLPFLRGPATTAAPPPSAFESVYERLLSSGVGRILSIHLSRRLSGMYGMAAQAARRFGERVLVVDSGQVSLGLGFQVLEAARAIRRGHPFQAVLEALDRAGRCIRTIAMIENMDYLRRSGRVDWLRGSLGSLLHVRLLLEVADGIIHRLGQSRTRKGAIDELWSLATRWGPIQRWGVMHSGAPEEAEALAARLPSGEACEPPLVVEVTTVIAAHAGPRCLGVAGLLR